MGPEQRAENDDDDQELIQVLNDVEEMFGQPVFFHLEFRFCPRHDEFDCVLIVNY